MHLRPVAALPCHLLSYVFTTVIMKSISKSYNPIFFAFLLLLFTTYCGKKKKALDDGGTTQLEPEGDSLDLSDGWDLLMDGTSLEGWRGLNIDTIPPNWGLTDGVLSVLSTSGEMAPDLIYSKKKYENFELAWEWKISEGANSGVLYHVGEGEQYTFAYETGPEYQIIDDASLPDDAQMSRTTSSDYDMYGPDGQQKLYNLGDWNSSRIVFTKEKVEHWLNDKMVLSFVPWSEDWESRRSLSKWKDFPGYGRLSSGFIAFQDHGNPVWFRNIRARQL